MFKTLRWIYNLGIKHERVRIARVLEKELYMQNSRLNLGVDMLENNKDWSRQRKQRLEFTNTVADQVAQIVNQVLIPIDNQNSTRIFQGEIKEK